MKYTTSSTVEEIEKQNGRQDLEQFVDNRVQIDVDARQVETWEIMVMEEGNITKAMMVFARYLARGGRKVSPDLPSAPVDELNKADIALIKNSEAYRQLKRMKLPELRGAIESFVEGASAGF